MLRYHYGAGHVTQTCDERPPPALARTMRPIVVRVLQRSPLDTPSPGRTNSSFLIWSIYRVYLIYLNMHCILIEKHNLKAQFIEL